MYGDKLKQAIDTINEYLEEGNEITLYVQGQSLELNGIEPLQFILLNVKTEEGGE